MINVTDRTARELTKKSPFLKPVVRIKHRQQGGYNTIYLSTTPHSTITVNYDQAIWNGIDWVEQLGISSLPGVTFLPLLMNLPEVKDSYDFKTQKWQTQTSRIEISNEPSIYLSTDSKSNVRFSEAFTRNAFTNAIIEVGLTPDTQELADVAWLMTGRVKYTTYTTKSFILETEDYTSTMFDRELPNPSMWYPDNVDVWPEFRNTPYPMVFGHVDRSPCKFQSEYTADYSRHTVSRIDVDQETTAAGNEVSIAEYNWTESVTIGENTFVVPPLMIYEGESFVHLVDELETDQGDLTVPFDPDSEETYEQLDRNFTWQSGKPYIGVNMGADSNSVSADKLRIAMWRIPTRVQALVNRNDYNAEWYPVGSDKSCIEMDLDYTQYSLPLETRIANTPDLQDTAPGGIFYGDQSNINSDTSTFPDEVHHDQYLCLRFTFDSIPWDEPCFTWIVLQQSFSTIEARTDLSSSQGDIATLYDNSDFGAITYQNYQLGWSFSQVSLHGWTFTKNRQSDKVLLTEDDGLTFDPSKDYIGDEHTKTFYSYDNNNVPIIELKRVENAGSSGSRLEDYPGRTKKILDSGYLGNHRGNFSGEKITHNFDNYSENSTDSLWSLMVGRPSKKGVVKEGMFQTFGSAEEIFYGLPRFMCVGNSGDQTDLQTLAIEEWVIQHFSIYQMGFVDKLSERNYFVNVKGRRTGPSGPLMENPVQILEYLFQEELMFNYNDDIVGIPSGDNGFPQEILEDVLRGDDPGRWLPSGGSYVDQTSKNIALQALNGWKFAFTIVKPIKVKDLCEGMFFGTPVFPKLKHNGLLEFATTKLQYFEEDYIEAFALEVDDILGYKFDRTKQEDIKTKVRVSYNYNYATDKYDSITSYFTVSSLPECNSAVPLTDPNGEEIYIDSDTVVLDYYNYPSQSELKHKYTTLDYECPYVRDQDTANKMRDYLIRQHCNDHIVIELDLPLSYLKLSVGDVVKFPRLINDELAFGINYTVMSSPARIYRYPLFQITEVQNLGNKIKIKLLQLHNLSDVSNDIDSNGPWSTYWFTIQPTTTYEEVEVPIWQIVGGFWGDTNFLLPDDASALTTQVLENISLQEEVEILPSQKILSPGNYKNHVRPTYVAFKYFTHWFEDDNKTHIVPQLPPHKLLDPKFFTININWQISQVYNWLVFDIDMNSHPDFASSEIGTSLNYLQTEAESGYDGSAAADESFVIKSINLGDYPPICYKSADDCWQWTDENLGDATIIPFILRMLTHGFGKVNDLSYNDIIEGRDDTSIDELNRFNPNYTWPCFSAVFFAPNELNDTQYTWLQSQNDVPIGGPLNHDFWDINDNQGSEDGLPIDLALECCSWFGDPFAEDTTSQGYQYFTELGWKHIIEQHNEELSGWWTGGSNPDFENGYFLDEYRSDILQFKGIVNSQMKDYEYAFNQGLPVPEEPFQRRCWVRFVNDFPVSDDGTSYTSISYKPSNAQMTVWNNDMLDFQAFLGDVNGDGGVGILDMVQLNNYMINGTVPDNPFFFECADINGDGIIDIMDLVLLINMISS